MHREGTRRRRRARLGEIVLTVALAALPIAVAALPVPQDASPEATTVLTHPAPVPSPAPGSDDVQLASLGLGHLPQSVPPRDSLANVAVSRPTANILLALGLAGLTLAGSRHSRRLD